tara:strand:- start:456 stop:1088 length:633 start_codon:yes stop_codon:yes gene_type:complete
MSAIVFDYDKTLGYFDQLHKIYILCNKNISINALLLIFPKVFRPYFFEILKYLLDHKKKYSIILYTNNKGPRYFIDSVVDFINTKFGCKVFDFIIYGYKTSDGRIEDCRKNSKKRFDDLLPCTGKKFYNVLFLDDSLHVDMIDEKVEYLQIEPYYYSCFNDIERISKFLKENELQDLKICIKNDKIPKSCDKNENIQIFKAIILFVTNLK